MRARSGAGGVCALEPLEQRRLLSVAASATTNCIPGLTPQQVRQQYGLDQLQPISGQAAAGSRQTIAIVDAYGDPTLTADVATFDAAFNLPAASLQIVNQTGGSSLPTNSNGLWASQTAADVEWAHAVAPDASILVVEASSDKLSNMLAAVAFARQAPGVSSVSMSWGRDQFAGQTTLDWLYTTPSSHQGITFVAASGNGDGGNLQWPGASREVLGAGVANDTSGASESALGTQAGVTRDGSHVVPEVALDADGSPGFAAYDSRGLGWQSVAGTSVLAPQWAGVIAIADQSRQAHGEDSLDGATQTVPTLHGLSSPTPTSPTGSNLVSTSGVPDAGAVIAALTTVANAVKTLNHHVQHPPPGPGGGGQIATPAITPAVPPTLSQPQPTVTPRPAVIRTFGSAATASLLSGAGSAATAALTFNAAVVRTVAATTRGGEAALGTSSSAISGAIFSTAVIAASTSSVQADALGAIERLVARAWVSFAPTASGVATAVPQQAVESGAADAALGSITGAGRTVANVFHINAAATFADAMALMIDQSAVLKPTPRAISHLRAWLVTGVATAADIALLVYWSTGRKATPAVSTEPRTASRESKRSRALAS